ncbi:MAG: hypothetical protein J6J71_01275 [Prevotella sp.]|nr:hypothetical protein [Prevotella sp.]
MAQHSGFFNALQSDGVYDRKYNADDYTSNLAAIISTGVRRSGDDDLRVTANGLNISVAAGRAWIDGRWFYNDTAQSMGTVTPPVGTLRRVDGVYLQANSNVNVRNIQLVYKTGTPSSNPTAPACTRANGVYEIQLASISVAPNATSVSVTDTRGNTNVCGWITSPVGYDDFFTSLDNEFTTWFENTKDTLASVTLFKQYMWRTVLNTAAPTVTFNIPQYTAGGTDIINVYVNGLLETPTDDYTLNGSKITFTQTKIAGTEIVVMCYKSIDGTGLGSVSDEITALQNQVAALGNINQYYYFCNGQTDNVQLSQIVQNFLNGSTSDNKKMKINVVGTFGATSAAAGSGTTTSRYRWFNFAPSAATNRQVTLDFYNCSPVNIQPPGGKFNTIFYGGNFNIEGLTLTAGGSNYTTLHLQGVDGAAVNAPISFTDCNITLHGGWAGGTFFFSEYGTFTNCKIIVINTLNSAAVFALMSNTAFVQVNGGRYYGYTGLSLGFGTGVYSATGLTTAAITINGAIFPSTAKTSLYQTNAVRFNSGYLTAIGIISQLDVSTTSDATKSITGTIPLDKD